MSNFHPLEVVGRGSETLLQVGGNLNRITNALSEEILISTNQPVLIFLI